MAEGVTTMENIYFVERGYENFPGKLRELGAYIEKIEAEREAKQRAGAPREIRRKCKACGKYFTFPNTAEHYPVYCGACRKQQRAEKKAKYSRKPAQDKKPED